MWNRNFNYIYICIYTYIYYKNYGLNMRQSRNLWTLCAKSTNYLHFRLYVKITKLHVRISTTWRHYVRSTKTICEIYDYLHFRPYVKIKNIHVKMTTTWRFEIYFENEDAPLLLYCYILKMKTEFQLAYYCIFFLWT